MNTSNMPGSLLTFALGVGVGAAVALLLTPRSGEELRKDISGSVTDGVNELKAAGKHVKRRASSPMRNSASMKRRRPAKPHSTRPTTSEIVSSAERSESR